MRRNILLLLVFALSLSQMNCGQQAIPSRAEKKDDTAPEGEDRDRRTVSIVTDILLPVGSLSGFCHGQWTVMYAYVAMHERPSDGLNRIVLKMEIDNGRRNNSLPAALLSTSELNSFAQAITRVRQTAAAMKTQEVENTHVRIEVKRGMCIGFEQRGYEQDAYISFNPTQPDALLHFDMADLLRLEAIAYKGSERLRALGVP